MHSCPTSGSRPDPPSKAKGGIRLGVSVVNHSGLPSPRYHWHPGKRLDSCRVPTPLRLSATEEAAIGGGRRPRMLTSGAVPHDSSPPQPSPSAFPSPALPPWPPLYGVGRSWPWVPFCSAYCLTFSPRGPDPKEPRSPTFGAPAKKVSDPLLRGRTPLSPTS